MHPLGGSVHPLGRCTCALPCAPRGLHVTFKYRNNKKCSMFAWLKTCILVSSEKQGSAVYYDQTLGICVCSACPSDISYLHLLTCSCTPLSIVCKKAKCLPNDEIWQHGILLKDFFWVFLDNFFLLWQQRHSVTRTKTAHSALLVGTHVHKNAEFCGVCLGFPKTFTGRRRRRIFFTHLFWADFGKLFFWRLFVSDCLPAFP